MFFETCSLKNLAIFTRKDLYLRLFLKFLIKKRLQHKYFPVNNKKFLRKAFACKKNTGGCFLPDPIIYFD